MRTREKKTKQTKKRVKTAFRWHAVYFLALNVRARATDLISSGTDSFDVGRKHIFIARCYTFFIMIIIIIAWNNQRREVKQKKKNKEQFVCAGTRLAIRQTDCPFLVREPAAIECFGIHHTDSQSVSAQKNKPRSEQKNISDITTVIMTPRKIK